MLNSDILQLNLGQTAMQKNTNKRMIMQSF